MTAGAILRLIWSLAGEALVESVRLAARFWWATLAVLLLAGASMLWLDRPAALWFYALPPGDKALFALLNEVGRSGWMFALCGVVLLVAAWARRGDWVLRAGFVIGAVAWGGLVINVIKVVLARARPRELLAHDAYGFRWFDIDAAWNSFPSGHSQAIAAFAMALGLIWPRLCGLFLALAVLPAVARMVMANHFAADVLGGYSAGVLVTLGLARAIRARGLGPLRA